jgi:hypothetical protein
MIAVNSFAISKPSELVPPIFYHVQRLAALALWQPNGLGGYAAGGDCRQPISTAVAHKLKLVFAGPGSISRLLGSVAVGHVVASLESTAAVVAAEGVHEGVDRKSGPGGVALKQEMRAW